MSGQMDLGLDRNHAHVQPNGAYHYHGLPIGLIERLGATKDTMTLVGWAADGFPIYAVYGYKDADDAKSEVTELKPSYRLKNRQAPEASQRPRRLVRRPVSRRISNPPRAWATSTSSTAVKASRPQFPRRNLLLCD